MAKRHSTNPDPTILARRLKSERTSLGLTTYDVARGATVTEGMMRHLESGNIQSPGFHIMLRIARFLGKDPYAFTVLPDALVVTEHRSLADRIAAVEEITDNIPVCLLERIQQLEAHAGITLPLPDERKPKP